MTTKVDIPEIGSQFSPIEKSKPKDEIQVEESLDVDASKGSSSLISEKSLKELLVETDFRAYYSHQKPEEERPTTKGPSITINKIMTKSANSFFKIANESRSNTIEIDEFKIKPANSNAFSNNIRKGMTLSISSKFAFNDSARLTQSVLPTNRQSSCSETPLIETENIQPQQKTIARTRTYSLTDAVENRKFSKTAPENFFPTGGKELISSSNNLLSRSMVRTTDRISSQSPNPK
jgi:hypothetical protein